MLSRPIITASRALRPLSSRAFRSTTTRPFIRQLSHSPFRQQEEPALHQQGERQWSTPLAKQLFEAISLTGPVPLASYMRMCLTGDLGGYYTGAIGEGRDQFGTKGDFVTSPEISQIFGELIGIWFIAEWINQGRPKSGVQIIEIGPGRGTLMDDMLRTIQRFPAMAASIESVYMVEASKELRETQRNLLCGTNAQTSRNKIGTQAASKYDGKPVIWAETMKSIPYESDKVPFIVAHEFFDALPIHIFESAKGAPPKPKINVQQSVIDPPPKTETPEQDLPNEWRELMVSPVPPHATHKDLKTPTSEQHEPVPEFQLIMSSQPTRHSRYVPESSPRYRTLKETVGSVVEVCPDASLYATDFATRIGGSEEAPKKTPSGAALILDYGTQDTVPINSLRGIRAHKRVNPFSAPGMVDLSADVDFMAIAEAAMIASEGIEVHGPIRQGDFLELMGIRERAEMLTKIPGITSDAAENIDRSWKRLVDRGPGGMGKVYKALAILPENDGRRRPVGFGGDVKDKYSSEA